MHHDDRNAGAMVALKPVMHHALERWGQVAIARAGVPEQAAIFAEDQVEERHLCIRATGLPQDIEVRVVFMDLPLGHFHAFWATGLPMLRKDSALEITTVRFGKLRPSRDSNQRQQDKSHTTALHR